MTLPPPDRRHAWPSLTRGQSLVLINGRWMESPPPPTPLPPPNRRHASFFGDLEGNRWQTLVRINGRWVKPPPVPERSRP